MARKKTRNAGGRGSAEAIEKRRAARQLNALLTGGSSENKLDGRTEKRRKRLIKELKDGRRGKPLSPIDYVSHVDELIDLGESPASLRKQGVKPRKVEQTPEVTEVVLRAQGAYSFKAQAWKMLGIKLPGADKRKGRPRKVTKARKASRRRA